MGAWPWQNANSLKIHTLPELEMAGSMMDQVQILRDKGKAASQGCGVGFRAHGALHRGGRDA